MIKRMSAALLMLFSVTLLPGQTTTREPGNGDDLLARRYKEGETFTYEMKASNRDQTRTIAYTIQAHVTVKKDAQGEFYEQIAWSDMVVNGNPFPLPESSQSFRQLLTLEPNPQYNAIPDLSKVHPILIGPITDLLTFYADIMIAHHGKLEHAGDHFYFPKGTPVSWADGHYVTLGQSSIDFDVTLKDVNEARHVATLLVRHVPPAQSQIKTPAQWMREPVADTPNNWVLVNGAQGGKFTAAVGKETFDVEIKISLEDGHILSAKMRNPVEVKQRICDDAALTKCGEPVRYEILRQVEVVSSP